VDSTQADLKTDFKNFDEDMAKLEKEAKSSMAG